MTVKFIAIFLIMIICCFSEAQDIDAEPNIETTTEDVSIEDITADCPNIINRQEWGGRTPKDKENLAEYPAPYVVIHHSETPSCTTTESCKQRVKSIQNYHMDSRGWSDIGYNFLNNIDDISIKRCVPRSKTIFSNENIGGDGNVYEGRGWYIRGAHCPKYNTRSIGICMIGSFNTNLPSAIQLNALENFLVCATSISDTYSKISSNYHLIGHRQGKDTTCPGDALFNEIKRMPHWDSNPK